MINFELKFDFHAFLTFFADFRAKFGALPVIVENGFRHQKMRREKLARDRGDRLELADIEIQKNDKKLPLRTKVGTVERSELNTGKCDFRSSQNVFGLKIRIIVKFSET